MAYTEIGADELAALGDGVRVIDVREADEWAEAHIPYAVHVPLATVPASLDAFDGTPTYVVCKVGGRSAAACEFAAAQGRDVVNVIGGMLAWQAAGHDVVSGA